MSTHELALSLSYAYGILYEIKANSCINRTHSIFFLCSNELKIEL